MTCVSTRVRFRYPAPIPVAATVAFLGSLPMLMLGWYAIAIPLVPVVVAVWGLRAGTDADAAGLRLTALLGRRRIAWTDVAELAAGPRGQVLARLRDGTVLRLPAVRAPDLDRLVAAAGQQIGAEAGPAAQ